MPDPTQEQPDPTPPPHATHAAGDNAEGMFDLTPDGEDPALDDFSDEQLLDALEFGNTAGNTPGNTPGSTGDAGGQLEALQREKDELEAKLLRTTADYQNFVRRSAREVETTRQQRTMDIARALVGVLDHFDRALQVDPDTTSSVELLQGVASIRDELLKSLGNVGIHRVEVEPGTEFDPNNHEAMMHQPHDDFAAGQVVQMFLPGYAVNDTCVRPVQVSVAQ